MPQFCCTGRDCAAASLTENNCRFISIAFKFSLFPLCLDREDEKRSWYFNLMRYTRICSEHFTSDNLLTHTPIKSIEG